ncbi:MAG TPA: prolyl oligopeptidase family serine peptidase, partial [Rhodanobacteraceae bacterium]|nr:prolyl oligopeptidase family serine peptidase [Rhodanobacteraceae bacterium]
MRRIALAGLGFALTLAAAPVAFAQAPLLPTSPTAVAGSGPLTLEQIMADPDWIGPPVEDAYWSVDNGSVYFKLKRNGSQIRDLYRVDANGGTPVKLDDTQLAGADGYAVFDRSRAHAAFLRHGDVFVRDLANGATRQLTRDDKPRGELQFSPDGRLLSWHEGDDWMVCDLATGTVGPAATLKTEKDPAAKQPDQLERLQLHLFSTLREIKADKDAKRARTEELDREDASRASAPFYLGDDVKIDGSSLSPDARWMIVVTSPKNYQRGENPTVTHYVNDSGYPQAEKARTYVGRNKPAPESLVLLDLRAHKQSALSTENLPGIHDDPLKALRDKRIAELKKAGHDDEARALTAPKTRPVSLGFVMVGEGGKPAIMWSDDANNAAIELMANDHKDRWIVTVDFNNATLVTQDRLTDPAWINWSFNELGWLHDNRTLWFESEASGWAQLYVKPLDGKARVLTGTGYEVSSPTVSPDDKWFYVLSNKQAPYDYDVYRLPTSGGAMQQVTHYEGLACFECSAPFALSPDGSKLAVLHSSAYVPPQLAVVDSDGSNPHDLTDTRTAQYKAMHWIEPQFVKVPSSHGNFGIWAKYYQPAGYDTSHSHPAVLFVHGAGYLQDVTKGWSYYFREQMFNNLLAQEGYVVLDMDYRASAGYGRDWRDSIYRHMGHPELEDLLDGKAWLVKNHDVDPKRVGIYGGSYGGFMTEMALLRAPGEFAAGAAQRAPSDWTSYNDDYTSDILNDPQLDPEAYKVSSPIEYAANLQDPLLMNHGLIDNNVMPGDTIRLYQRFIELHKKNFWISLYPMERHDFKHADSWYDEYRRIH